MALKIVSQSERLVLRRPRAGPGAPDDFQRFDDFIREPTSDEDCGGDDRSPAVALGTMDQHDSALGSPMRHSFDSHGELFG